MRALSSLSAMAGFSPSSGGFSPRLPIAGWFPAYRMGFFIAAHVAASGFADFSLHALRRPSLSTADGDTRDIAGVALLIRAWALILAMALLRRSALRYARHARFITDFADLRSISL